MMRRPVLYLAGVLLATGASLALAGPASAAPADGKCRHNNSWQWNNHHRNCGHDHGWGHNNHGWGHNNHGWGHNNHGWGHNHHGWGHNHHDWDDKVTLAS